MPSVDQPRARAASIPPAAGGDGPYSRALAPVACPRPDLVDSSPAAQADALDPPRQGAAARSDDMLSLAHLAGSASSASSTTSASSAASPASSDIAAPALPAKSSLRASRLLASLAQKPGPDDRPILPHAAPHHVYLSSEEDASSSADDLSDLDELNSDSGRSLQSSSSACSHEVTARVVRVVFHGRPSIVDLAPRRLADGCDGPAPGILRTVTEPALMRTRSISASSSSTAGGGGGVAFHLPPRSSSMLPSGFPKKQRPQFLTIDPYATRLPEADDQDPARASKTPATMFKRTLNLVKKRSRPLLNPAATPSRESLSPQASPMLEPEPEPEPEPEAAPPTSRPSLGYQSIIKAAARKSADRASPTTPGADGPSPTGSQRSSRFRSGLSITRPRSIRA